MTMTDEPTCGQGLARHAAIPAKLGELLAALAANLDLHRATLDLDDEGARTEDAAYRALVDRFRSLAGELAAAAREMLAGWEGEPANLPKIDNALASLAVGDFDRAVGWYERLFGRPADATPMPDLAEWRFPRGGWLQVYAGPERAGRGSCTLAVSDLDAVRAHLEAIGVALGDQPATPQVRTIMIRDPDGNSIAFAEATDPSLAH
ncbi:MAG TPA: VOC family protein [Thermoanaerobaculia bacterium]|nr:VOC family protein [Thermoanaerobaculia bacterium]